MKGPLMKLVKILALLVSTSSFAQAQPPTQNLPDKQPAAQAGTGMPSPSGMALSDDQISGVVMVANQGEIDQAQMALKSGKDKAVKEFANMMVKDHGKVKKELTGLQKSEKLKTADSDLKRTFEDAGKASKERLKGMKGADFDKAYMDEQVKAHQELLTNLDTNLIPGAKNAKLKALLEKIRPDVAAHLEHAKKWTAGETGEAAKSM